MFTEPRSVVQLLDDPLPRSVVMGVLNVTPDSFSDGGRFASSQAAVQQACALRDQGADIIDVGGESTRPGAQRPTPDQELARVLPVITELAGQGLTVSVDTLRAEVAKAAVQAGAQLVNDVSGGLADPGMLDTVAACGVPFLAMHWRAHAATMQQHSDYDDVVAEVAEHLHQRLEACRSAGISRVLVDPGLGFAKQPEHNWALLAALPSLQALGVPVLVGASRKRFLGALLDRDNPTERDDATTAITALAAAQRVWGIRTHAVRASADAVRVAAAWLAAAGHGDPAGTAGQERAGTGQRSWHGR